MCKDYLVQYIHPCSGAKVQLEEEIEDEMNVAEGEEEEVEKADDSSDYDIENMFVSLLQDK